MGKGVGVYVVLVRGARAVRPALLWKVSAGDKEQASPPHEGVQRFSGDEEVQELGS